MLSFFLPLLLTPLVFLPGASDPTALASEEGEQVRGSHILCLYLRVTVSHSLPLGSSRALFSVLLGALLLVFCFLRDPHPLSEGLSPEGLSPEGVPGWSNAFPLGLLLTLSGPYTSRGALASLCRCPLPLQVAL